jgi:hypothetical protein
LNFDLLEADEFARLYLHNELSLCLIGLAPLGRAFNLRNKLFGVDDLIDLKTTYIASIDCDLNTWLDIRTASDNTLDIDKLTYLL